jgi:hypothetical protein
VDTESFYISDGCMFSDGVGSAGARVLRPAGVSLNNDEYVIVTGISSCTSINGQIFRMIRPVDGADGVRKVTH